MSTTLRQCTLRFLKALGINQFRSHSGLGLPFIVHIGDSFGEMPYYNLQTHCAEINLMAAWCRQVENPLILDVGGHVGFIATQLAQLLENKTPLIYSFEPVPYTFKRLLESIRALGLEHTIVPVCAACSDEPGLVRLSYSEWNSMLAQIFVKTPNQRVGDKTALATSVTIDQTLAFLAKVPDLIKIDAEGHEVNILKGGCKILGCTTPPAVCFEFNPLTLSESGTDKRQLREQLYQYEFYYVGDFQNQRIPFGSPVSDLTMLDWVCNLFAVPRTKDGVDRWRRAVEDTARVMRDGDGLSATKRPRPYNFSDTSDPV